MTTKNELMVITIPAACAIVVGILMNAMSFASTPETVARLRRKAAELQSLRVHEKAAAQERAAIGVLDTFAGQSPVSLKSLADETTPGVEVDIRENDPKPAVPGWRLREADVTFAELPLQDVAAYMRKAETARPPWRLTACTIRSSPQSAGRGQVTLAFEALESQ